MKAMAQGTKQRILETSLRLFNQHGTAHISTNHVVDALRMSPGNLYYHYRNKASIIRGLFAQFCEEASRPGIESEEGPPVFQLGAWFERRTMLLARYEFLSREVFALADGDTWVRERFDRLASSDRIQLMHWISAAVDRGAVRPIEPDTRRALAEALILRAWFGSLLPRFPRPGPDRAGSYALDLLGVVAKQ